MTLYIAVVAGFVVVDVDRSAILHPEITRGGCGEGRVEQKDAERD